MFFDVLVIGQTVSPSATSGLRYEVINNVF
jgi:hypothetical protein